MSDDTHHIRQTVRDNYARVVQNGNTCCGTTTSCCGSQPVKLDSTRLGYREIELAELPAQADLGLGCGNPIAIATLKGGETVLDLGCGAGIDCFLAARQVGQQGHVIGVDMTSEMLTQARANAIAGGYSQVEFRLGEIEHLPVADASVDVIISNCVVNLSPDKPQVFREAFRVLKAGGRLALSDVVALAEIPPPLRADPTLYCGCISGAESPLLLQQWLELAGFINIVITPQNKSRDFIADWAPGQGLESYVVSTTIIAQKQLSPISNLK